jgi:hypothetical protein
MQTSQKNISKKVNIQIMKDTDTTEQPSNMIMMMIFT